MTTNNIETPALEAGQIRLANESIAVTVCSTRGGEIRFVGKPGGPNLLFWDDWASPLRRSRSATYGSDEADWLSEWRGGWQELFPNAGAPATVMGVPVAFHGEASNAQWEVVTADATSAELRTAARLPLTLTRRMRIDRERPVLYIDEVVHNESALHVPFVWGHHPSFDAVPGTALDIPANEIVVPADYTVSHADLAAGTATWPMATGRDGKQIDLRVVPEGPVERVVYLPNVTAGWAALRRPDGNGAAFAWDTSAHPHVWMWTEIGGVDFPWFGRSRVVALEPAAAWPNDGLAGAISRNQAHNLGPGESVSSWLTLSLIDDTGSPVSHVSRDGQVRWAR